MNGRLIALTMVVLLAVAVGGAGAVELPYNQDFEAGVEALRAEGWRLHPNATVTDDTPRGRDLCLIVETVQLLNRLQPWLTARRTEGDELEVAAPFRAWSRVADGARVMALVNTADDDAQLSVDLAALGAQDVRDFETGEAVALTGARLIAPFAPHEVRVYTWNVAQRR